MAGGAGGSACAALAYLTKSIAAPLLVTVPLCFALRKHYRKAGLFFATMLPAVAAWQWWVARHLTQSWDLVTLYYTNYVGFEKYNVPLHDLPLVIWYNLDGFVTGAGKLLIFDLPYGAKALERVVAIAAIAGCIRLAARTRRLQYPLAALGMSAVLLVWHFPPDQRFVFPLYPLLLMGVATEIGNIGRRAAAHVGEAGVRGSLRRGQCGRVARRDRGLCRILHRIRAQLFYSRFVRIPIAGISKRAGQLMYGSRATRRPDANVYAYDDPLVFLYTGRRACQPPDSSQVFLSSRQRGRRKADGLDGGFRPRLRAGLSPAHARRLSSRPA